MKKLKVAMVCDWYAPRIGGIEIHIQDLAQQLKKQDIDVHVVTTTPGPTMVDGIPIHRLALSRLPFYDVMWNRKRGLAKLKALFLKEKFDVIHAHSFYSPLALCGVYLSRKLNIASVLSNHSLLRWPKRSMLLYKYYAHLWSKWPDLFTAVSSAVAEDTISASLSRQVKVEVIPNGIYPDGWKCDRLPCEPKRVRMVSVMRLTSRKRPHLLIKAFSHLQRKFKTDLTLELSVIGDGRERKRLEKLTKKFGLDRQIQFLGFKSHPEIKKIFSQSDLFILPSSYEALSIAILEARSAGLPVIAMNHGGVGDIIQHGFNGLLANTFEELVKYMSKTITQPDMLKAFGNNSRVGIEDFCWSKVIHKHLSTYQRAIEISKAS